MAMEMLELLAPQLFQRAVKLPQGRQSAKWGGGNALIREYQTFTLVGFTIRHCDEQTGSCLYTMRQYIHLEYFEWLQSSGYGYQIQGKFYPHHHHHNMFVQHLVDLKHIASVLLQSLNLLLGIRLLSVRLCFSSNGLL